MPEAEALSNIVQTERIGNLEPIALGTRGLVGIENHVEDPAGDKHAEDFIHVVCKGCKHSEDDDVRNPLRELAVVHGAYAGNEAEQRCQSWIRGARHGRHVPRRWVRGTVWRLRILPPCRSCTLPRGVCGIGRNGAWCAAGRIAVEVIHAVHARAPSPRLPVADTAGLLCCSVRTTRGTGRSTTACR